MAEKLTRLRVELPLDERQINALVSIAVRHGYVREEPRRAWGRAERREAARYAMERLISTQLTLHMQRRD